MTSAIFQNLQTARVPPQVLIVFARQMQLMLDSGVPLHRALEQCARGKDAPVFSEILDRIGAQIISGHNFSSSAQRFPGCFDAVFLAILRIGEETGQLSSMMGRYADWKERDLAMARQLKSALAYPGLVLVLTVGMSAFLFTTVLPDFIQVFEDMDIRTPFVTKLLIAVTKTATSPFFQVCFLVLGVALFGFIKRTLDTPAGRLGIWHLGMSVPIVSKLLRGSSLSRYCRACSVVLASGTTLVRALDLGAQASANAIIQNDLPRVSQAVVDGTELSFALGEKPDIYPRTVGQLLVAGEESSSLESSFEYLAVLYEREVKYLSETMNSVLEPLLLIGVSGVLGFVLLGVFLPLYSHLDHL